ncbi:PilW family protein [Pseudomonas huanghezhanensis]|uniref:PilW family protein n=1 Tax=Pseudomonas huanghezhanensis TaxID=3002903 RepID=UPI002285C2F9|nr:prepilin-type N-terminal cleavage/methylation domain-containing protein [Pseudomonas sp. BSw22131]
MSRRSRGFGLIELMVALTLSLVMAVALTQMFISSKDTYLSQMASANLQEDARFVLNKLAQDIRMVGTFGCLASVRDASDKGDFAGAFQNPIHWQASAQSLTLVTASVDGQQGEPVWTVRTDCAMAATAYSQGAGVGELSFPVQRHVYAFNARAADLRLNGAALISNVSAFSVLFGVADSPAQRLVSRYVEAPDNPALIRSVRITLTLSDPAQRVKEQTFSMVAALRNRLG